MLTVFGSELSKQRSKRSSIIPYTFLGSGKKAKLMFLMGVHSSSGELSDFGGGIKKDETDIDGAYREFNEETRNIFENDILIKDLNTCVCLVRPKITKTIGPLKTKVTRDGMSSIFVPINKNQIELVEKFETSISSDTEISKIMWINEDEFREMVSGKCLKNSRKRLWRCLQNFYMEVNLIELREFLYVRFVWFDPPTSINAVSTPCKDDVIC